MKSKINICAGLVLVSLSLNGCATIIEGAHDKMYVQSAPVSGAFCKIYNEEGTYYVTTPGMITVSKSGHGLHATCAKDGFEESNQFISSHFQPVTLGNIVIGGAIGFGVDASSGAMFDYPKAVQVILTPAAVVPSTGASSIRPGA